MFYQNVKILIPLFHLSGSQRQKVLFSEGVFLESSMVEVELISGVAIPKLLRGPPNSVGNLEMLMTL